MAPLVLSVCAKRQKDGRKQIGLILYSLPLTQGGGKYKMAYPKDVLGYDPCMVYSCEVSLVQI